jgi:ElaB/YqjD/DUF883 family membrane-anchored ribosome-binding protein
MNTETQLREDTAKDPATLEREINQTRAEMNQTLDSLERKLTAGQLLDQCLTFFGMKGTEIGSSLGRCVKDNPMPVLLTATGIGWMMFGPSQTRSAVRDNRYDYDDAKEGADGMMAKMSDTMQSGVTATRQQFAKTTETAKETVNRTTDKVKETAGRATDSLRDTVNKTADFAQSQANQVREGFNTLLEEQPLILGAVGLAVGAMLGAAFPSTEQEDRLVGEIRDKTINKGKELGAQAYEKGSELAKQNIERAVQATSGKQFDDSDRRIPDV